ncbi:MAG: ABC transporter ATP-binding protein [Candidatus Nanopelagicaceae bacterium]
MSSSYVQLVDIAKHFGKVKALDGLTLDISKGEFVALLGPSGCGKTTALRALAGLQELDRGQIIVDGKNITHVAPNKRNMGMVFQAYSLFPHMTAKENVEYGLKLKVHKTASDKRGQRSGELLELVGLSSHANHYPHQMSGGQQQRIALARALAISPQVLLLDEPLSALDAKVRTQLRDEIRRIQWELGTTTLFVTHDQEEALGIADRVGVMRNGLLEQIAAPAELYDRPATSFVAEFVGLTNRVKVNVSNGSFTAFGTKLSTLPGSVTSGEGTALIRPEALTVKSDKNGDGKVVATSFLGSICRVMVSLPNGSRINAQMESQDAAGLTPGTSVEISADNVAVFVI